MANVLYSVQQGKIDAEKTIYSSRRSCSPENVACDSHFKPESKDLTRLISRDWNLRVLSRIFHSQVVLLFVNVIPPFRTEKMKRSADCLEKTQRQFFRGSRCGKRFSSTWKAPVLTYVIRFEIDHLLWSTLDKAAHSRQCNPDPGSHSWVWS